MEENQHIALVTIDVLQEWRRHGLATRLLRPIADFTRSESRSVMFGETTSTIPAGEVFMKRLGAEVGIVGSTNELSIEDLNHDLLRAWSERARERAADFDLQLWEGPYPKEDLEEIAQMYEAGNLEPRGDLEVEDIHLTGDQIREMDEAMIARGDGRWTLCARERASGTIAGFTEMFWSPGKPNVMQQGLTAVFEEFQNRGLGRWLKAAMLEKVLHERPEVRRITTGNATTNAPMLSINTALGFRSVSTEYTWQVPIDRVEEYLRGRATPAAP